jgi:hypothetical protein
MVLFNASVIPVKETTKTMAIMRTDLAYFVRPINLGLMILCVKFSMSFSHKNIIIHREYFDNTFLYNEPFPSGARHIKKQHGQGEVLDFDVL